MIAVKMAASNKMAADRRVTLLFTTLVSALLVLTGDTDAAQHRSEVQVRSIESVI